MDDTLTAVIIGAAVTLVGSLLTFLGSFLTHFYTLKKEEKHWTRQQDAEDKKWIRDQDQGKENKEVAQKEIIYTKYQDSIHNLSLLTAKEPETEVFKITGEKRLNLIEEAQKSLAFLAIRIGENYIFNNQLRSFSSSPDKYAEDLRSVVIELAAKDADLSSKHKSEIKSVTKEEVKPKKGEIHFSLSIDNDFRKEQIIEGLEVPDSHAITLNLTDLTKEQRTLLVDIYFDIKGRIPDRISLVMPDQTIWKAKLNPSKSEAKDFIEQWRVDYERLTPIE